jgi:hypothetical protein
MCREEEFFKEWRESSDCCAVAMGVGERNRNEGGWCCWRKGN